jgi:hypothetical protein
MRILFRKDISIDRDMLGTLFAFLLVIKVTEGTRLSKTCSRLTGK